MSAILTVRGVLNLIYDFLGKNVRKTIADRLKDGDVTDEQCRRIILGALGDIKSKLGGLARKDLLSGVCFLQEGINRLYESLLQFPSDESGTESTEQATLVEALSFRATGLKTLTPVHKAATIINAFSSLRIHSNERYKSAIKSFKLAREKATEAFCNESLSIKDRILASQIRIMARILENLEDPDASISDCLQYLKQLQDTGAIREIFSVLMDGGMKSHFNQTERLENASSVHVMNQILFDFARKFAKTYSPLAFMFRLPMILVGKKIYSPVFGEKQLPEKFEDSGVQVMTPCPDFTFCDEIDRDCAVVNSDGQIVAYDPNHRTIKIFKRSGKSRSVCEVPIEKHALITYVAAMDIDAEDNLYVIVRFPNSDDHSWIFKLFMFDENGNKKLETPLSFHQSSDRPKVLMSINNDGKIAILNYEEKMLYIGNVCFETNSYELDKSVGLDGFNFSFFNPILRISDLNGTKIVVKGDRAVYIFTENGQFQRQIEIPDEYGEVKRVVINHATKRILVKAFGFGRSSLLSFSESGELLYYSHLWCPDWFHRASLISHPNGPVALVSYKEGFLLQR